MVLVFDLFFRNIKVLFLMMVVANYAVYFMFIILMHSDVIAVDAQRERRLLPFKIVAHTLYAFLFFVAIHPSFGRCDDTYVYRKSISQTDLLLSIDLKIRNAIFVTIYD
jgi:hypothetical protein